MVSKLLVVPSSTSLPVSDQCVRPWNPSNNAGRHWVRPPNHNFQLARPRFFSSRMPEVYHQKIYPNRPCRGVVMEECSMLFIGKESVILKIIQCSIIISQTMYHLLKIFDNPLLITMFNNGVFLLSLTLDLQYHCCLLSLLELFILKLNMSIPLIFSS